MAISLVALLNPPSQGTSSSNTSSAIDTTGANFLVVMVGRYTGTPTLSDSKGNTWVALTEQAATAHCRLYYCIPTSVGSGHTITVSGANTYSIIGFAAFSGVATSPLDQQNGSHQASGTSIVVGSITPSQNGCLLIAGCVANWNAPTINSGMTVASSSYAGGAAYGGSLAYLIQTSAAAINPTFTGGAGTVSTDNAAVIASFLPSSAALAAQNYRLLRSGGSLGVGIKSGGAL